MEEARRRPHRVVVTAGHVDHGKSTLLRALTGMEPDRLDEERRRGLSIELGFVWCTLAGTAAGPADLEVAFVDVPGHERFIATMLAGAGSAPAALLVVAADDGWSAQTQEHAEVLALLGTPVVATAITKSERVSAERLAEVATDVRDRTRRLGLSDGRAVVTDAVAGRGLEELRTGLRDGLATLPTAGDDGRARLWVDRRFVVAGAGTVVTGTLTGGHIHLGDRVTVLPAAAAARVRNLESLGGDVDEAGPGQRVAINLGGIDRDEVERGDAVVGGDGAWRASDTVEGWLRVLPGRAVGRRGAWHVHVGTAAAAARILPVVDTVAGEPDSDGGDGAVRVLLERPLPLAAGDVLVVRDAGRRRTVGAVRVADPCPGPSPRGRTARADHAGLLGRAAAADGEARLPLLVALGGGVRPVDELAAATGWDGTTPPPAGLVRLGSHVATETRWRSWVATLAGLGPGSHARSRVLDALRGGRVPGDLLDTTLAHLVDAGALVAVDTGFALPEHVDDETQARERRRRDVVGALLAEPFAPPALDEVARRHGADARDVAALVQRGEVVRVGKVAFAADAVRSAADALRGSALAARPFTAAEAREVVPTSRKFLIPLLEHLARTGVTTFDGAHHRVRPPQPGSSS